MAKYKIEHYHGSRGISTKTIESIEEVESSSVTEALKLCMREDWRIIEHSPSFASASNPECGSTWEDVWIAEEQTKIQSYTLLESMDRFRFEPLKLKCPYKRQRLRL